MQSDAESTKFQGSAIDHLNISVENIERSLEFYERALNAIGILKVLDVPGDEEADRPRMVGFGAERKPFFWLVDGGRPDPNLHVAFAVPSRNLVRRFFEAACKSGGKVKLEPGLRPEYHENYYGAFVYDADGINIEAVCHLADDDVIALVEGTGEATADTS